MLAAAAPPQHRFLSFAEAREVLDAFGRTEDATGWDAWIKAQDREVRARIERGVEDSISNLILYGTSFTSLPRLESVEAASSAGGLVETARARVRAMAAALARPGANERLRFVREYLLHRGIETKSIEDRKSTRLNSSHPSISY